MKTKHTLVALGVATLTMVGTTFAADDQQDPWRFGVSVPLWAPQINGNATVKGHQENVDISFSDLKDHLDASLSLAFQVRKEKYGFFGDFGYMKFTAGDHGVHDELKFLVADAGVLYRLYKTDSDRPFMLDGTLGVRYWRTENQLRIKDSGGTVLFRGTKDRDLVDPMVGLRATQFLTSKLHLDVLADIGGFGVSDNSADLDWSTTGLLTYDFTKWFSLSGGYKALALDKTTGKGTNKNGVDVIFNGFLISANFAF